MIKILWFYSNQNLLDASSADFLLCQRSTESSIDSQQQKYSVLCQYQYCNILPWLELGGFLFIIFPVNPI